VKLRWSEGARRDLYEIAEYIARDNARAAAHWIGKLRARAKLAAAAPKAGRVVPEYGRKEIREVFERNYRILYEITKGAIVVLAVFEGHRRLPDAVGESDE
jgi:toxin ParE1/3/4